MNHLAHALLADAGGTEFALGSAMGDFWRGRPDPGWPPARQAGVRFHRAIDHFTDTHPEVCAARRRFDPPLRRYAGILLDVWFDYLLVHAWERYCDEPLAAFSRRWLGLLDQREAELPAGLRRFLARMHAHDLPVAYGDLATIDAVLRGLATRLSRPSPLPAALPALEARATALHGHFEAFFPALQEHALVARADLGFSGRKTAAAAAVVKNQARDGRSDAH